MTDTCPTSGALVDREMGKIATQYREAEKFKAYLSHALGQVEGAALTICSLPAAFDLRTAIGDQLTLVGMRMGFPRCHCSCEVMPVYGAPYEDEAPPTYEIVGPCDDGVWLDCDAVVNSIFCIDDDEVYRGHLLARRYQIMGLYDEESLTAALHHLWGPLAWVAERGPGWVCIAPGRDLTAFETRLLRISVRVLPVAPGVAMQIHFGANPIVGIGDGWGGACDGDWLCPVPIDPYSC